MLKSIVLIGNAKEVPNSVKGNEGKEFVTLDLAVTIKSKGKESTDWIELICNGFWADFAKKYIKAGSRLFIDGTPKFGAYLAKDGTAKPATKVYVREMRLLNWIEGKDNEPIDVDTNIDGAHNG